MKHFFTVSVILFLHHISVAQTDSLYQQWQKATIDTAKASWACQIAFEYARSGGDSTIYWLQQAETLNKKSNNRTIGSYINTVKFAYYYNISNTDTATVFKNLCDKDSTYLRESMFEVAFLIYSGHLAFDKNNMITAIDFYNKARMLSSKINFFRGEASSLYNMAQVYDSQMLRVQALQLFQQSLVIYQRLGNTEEVINIMNSISLIYKELKNYDKSSEYINKAITLADNDSTMLLELLNTQGLIYIEKNQPQPAREVFEQIQRINPDDNPMLKYATTVNIASTYTMEKRFDKARTLLASVAKAMDSLDYFYGIFKTQQLIAENELQSGQYQQALVHTRRLLKLSYESGNLEDFVPTYESMFKAFEGLKQKDSALFYMHKYIAAKDSLHERQQIVIQQVTELEQQFQYKQQQEIVQLQQKQREAEQEARYQRLVMLSVIFIGGFLVTMAMVVVVYRSYRQKKADNLLLEQQKKAIEQQNAILETQKQEIVEKSHIIEHKNEEITNSINYALRIQQAALPDWNMLNAILPEKFLFFRPRDIVSGDFYWLSVNDNKIIMVVADCTGHGVPGAFMSMLGISFLNDIVNHRGILESHLILNNMRQMVKTSLHQTGKTNESKDGMDMVLCVYDTVKHTIDFAGANNSIYVVLNGELTVYKADRMPIGVYLVERDSFTPNLIQLQGNEMIYLFSDGYEDQTGGPSNRKYMSKNMKTMLASIAHKSANEQLQEVTASFDTWKEKHEQIDDVTLLGIRIPAINT